MSRLPMLIAKQQPGRAPSLKLAYAYSRKLVSTTRKLYIYTYICIYLYTLLYTYMYIQTNTERLFYM